MIQAQTMVQHAPPVLPAGHELAGRAVSELQRVLHEEQRVLSVAASGQPEPDAGSTTCVPAKRASPAQRA